jgi:ubiquinone/menaquinone biosynthesis C-methylase UbiE
MVGAAKRALLPAGVMSQEPPVSTPATSTLGGVGNAPAAAPLTKRVVDWLGSDADGCPPHIDPGKYASAVEYAKGRYAAGLDHYREVFRDIGFVGKRHGLDVGSGAGHWALAFVLDNERAAGVDRGEEFVALANGAAARAGLADRVRHAVGLAEALGFPDRCFDAVWAHSVLMYCDTEDAVSEIARVLEPGGHFYCGYSSTGVRLHCVYAGVESEQHSYLSSQLDNYLGTTLQRDGVVHAYWSNIRSATADELSRVCRAFGMNPVRCPGRQDGQRDFAGIPATIDLLCVKDADDARFRDELLGLSAASDEGRRCYRELLGLGLGKLVQGVLDERGEPLGDPDIRSLYVLAALRAGRAEEVAGLAQRVDSRARGLLALERRRVAEAIAAFTALSVDHPDRSFLLGAALLRAGRHEAAAKEFEQGYEACRRPVDCQFGAMLARLSTADWPEQRDRMLRVLRLLPSVLGASAEKIEALAHALAQRNGLHA